MFALSKDDPQNPVNFSRLRKWHIVCAGIYFIFNSTLGSSLPSGGIDIIAAEFGVKGRTQLVLLNSLFLVGFAIGPQIFGPMSEHLGRRPVIISTYLGYIIFTMACALAPNFAALLTFRLLSGVAAATPNAILGGLYADIYDNPRQRGKAVSTFMYPSAVGPTLGPVISGFASQSSWRLPFWIALGMLGVGLPLILTIPETYAPVLAKKRVKKAKKANQNIVGLDVPEDLNNLHGHRAEEFWVIFARPALMLIREPIVLFTSLYLALVYSVFYLFFQAYPIVFKGIYGLPNGEAGLTFLPFSGGATIAYVTFLWYSSYHETALAANAAWANSEEFRRLPLACFGAPTIVIGLFWLGWTSKESIHPAIPTLAGLWFGIGYLIIFIAMGNYLTDAYRSFSASAQSAASTVRSIMAVCLPLATTPMYTNLGVAWASSLLGFISLLMAGIPFVFLIYGQSIRKRSPFCQKVMEIARMHDRVRTVESDGEGTVKVSLEEEEKGIETPRTSAL